MTQIGINVRLEPDTLVEVEIMAEQRGISRSHVLRDLINLGITQMKRYGELSE